MKSSIFVDKLTPRSLFFLLCRSNYSTVNVMDGTGTYFSFCRLIFSIFQKELNVKDFSFSNLRDRENRSAYIETIRKTTSYSVELVDEIFCNNADLEKFDKELDRPFLRLVSLKVVQQVLFPVFLKLAAFDSIKTSVEDKLLIMSPGLGIEEYFRNSSEFENTIILPSLKSAFRFRLNFLFKPWLHYQRQKISAKLSGFSRKSSAVVKSRSVVLIQEDDVHDNLSYRKQPVWDSLSSGSDVISTLILKNHISKKLFAETDLDTLKAKNVFTVEYGSILTEDLGDVDKILKCNLSKLELIISEAIDNSRKQEHFSSFSRMIALRAKISTTLAVQLSLFLHRNQTRTIVLGDVYHHYSEISFLSSALSGVPVISYQYSSLWLTSPPMLSIADFHLIFSNLYKEIYRLGPIQPKQFYVAGYSHLTANKELQDRSSQVRATLHRNGVKTIISYFDETFFPGNKWALVDEVIYFDEIERIFTFIINNPEFGLILKPQYLHNALQKKYCHIPFVAEGFSTGRIIELCYGHKARNLVLPMEAGYASDFSICSKIGMTTAIELASVGQRAILLDNHGISTPFDHLLERVDVQYYSIDQIIEKIIQCTCRLGENTLGDWSAIITDFVGTPAQKSSISLEVFVKDVVNGKLSSKTDR